MVSSVFCYVTGKTAAFEGVCINDFIETEPNLLNFLADIFGRFRLEKIAMMADFIKCFFLIDVPAEQHELFRILWCNKSDVREGNVVTYRFTRHPWGVKSNPFIASFAIQKTFDDNTTGISFSGNFLSQYRRCCRRCFRRSHPRWNGGAPSIQD